MVPSVTIGRAANCTCVGMGYLDKKVWELNFTNRTSDPDKYVTCWRNIKDNGGHLLIDNAATIAWVNRIVYALTSQN